MCASSLSSLTMAIRNTAETFAVYSTLLLATMQAATWYIAMLVQLSHWAAACFVRSLVVVSRLKVSHMSTFPITMPYLGLFLDGTVLSRANSMESHSDLPTSPFAFETTTKLLTLLLNSPHQCNCAEEAARCCMQCDLD